MKILFLLRKNLIYGSQKSVIAKSGLLNSARITAGQLKKHLHVKTEIEVCVDGNEVDKFLHKHKPHTCVIEALWVTPEKLRELTQLHKRIVFFVLIHSEIAFLANEGNAISWINEYNEIDRVYPAFNSKKTFEYFRHLDIADMYLPNIYLDVEKRERRHRTPTNVFECGCFGAIRPFKNQLIQAMAAIIFANRHGFLLRFHMNTSRVEQGGEGVLKNIRALFECNKHEFIEHGWKERDEFLHTISQMTIGLQVSLTESFNIISSDFVHENVPIVVGKTIDWMPESQKVDPEDLNAIVECMTESFQNRASVIRKSIRALNKYNRRSVQAWATVLNIEVS